MASDELEFKADFKIGDVWQLPDPPEFVVQKEEPLRKSFSSDSMSFLVTGVHIPANVITRIGDRDRSEATLFGRNGIGLLGIGLLGQAFFRLAS
jgi:hypothetical protein